MRPRRISRLTGFGMLPCTVLLATGSVTAGEQLAATEIETTGRTSSTQDIESLPDPVIDCLGRTGECTLPRCVQFGGRCDTMTTHKCTAGLIGKPCTSSSHCHCPGNVLPDGILECQVNPTCCDSCPPIGCEDVECCTDVCNQDVYCCEVEWDDACASAARAFICHTFLNDDCKGARLMTDEPPSNATTNSGRATEDSEDPGFGCYVNNPGAPGLQTVWYKFVATYTSALLQTCLSNIPATDSLIQVFAVGDPTTPETACRSLIPIACSDDVVGCSTGGKNAKVCLQRLTPGRLYYVIVASKIDLADVVEYAYRLDISSLCDLPHYPPGDYCPDALPITDGTTAFSLADATMTPPVEICIPTMFYDKWYEYTATCSGVLTVETCGSSPESSPDTNLAIYASGDNGECLCPPLTGDPIACSADAFGDCGLGSRIVLDAVEGGCYKIRLADSVENRPSGQIKIECIPDKCPGLPPADSDSDGDVDLIDLAAFQRCFSGQAHYNDNSCCRVFDMPTDGDIDSNDWAEFVIRFNGP